jgi:hypothetical protein
MTDNDALGDADCFSRNGVDPMVIPQRRALGRLCSLVQHIALQPRFRGHGILSQHPIFKFRYQQ